MPGRFEDFFLVQVPLAGRARCRWATARSPPTPPRASIGSPTEHVDMTWEPAASSCWCTCAGRRRGGRRRARSSSTPWPTSARRRCARGYGWCTWPSTTSRPAVHCWAPRWWPRSSSRRSSRACWPPSPTAATQTAPVVPIGSRAVRRVLAAIEAEPERAWRLADLAACAGVSARTLQEAFQRELGSTPSSSCAWCGWAAPAATCSPPTRAAPRSPRSPAAGASSTSAGSPGLPRHLPGAPLPDPRRLTSGQRRRVAEGGSAKRRRYSPAKRPGG